MSIDRRACFAACIVSNQTICLLDQQDTEIELILNCINYTTN